LQIYLINEVLKFILNPFRIEDINQDPVEGVAVEVLLYNNIEWTSILTDTSTPTGIVTRNLLTELGSGIYSYKVVISEGNFYYGATEVKQYVVTEISTNILTISAPDSYFYGSNPADSYVELQLVVDNLNQPLAGFELISEFGSLSFSNLTDVDGLISYHLPKYENPGSISLIVNFLDNGVYKSSQLTLDNLIDDFTRLMQIKRLCNENILLEVILKLL
jgi:hypothetical protein